MSRPSPAVASLLAMPDDLPFTPSPRKGIAAVIRDADPHTLDGDSDRPASFRFTDANAARAFALAGHAICTVVSIKTGKRFTFKLERPKPKPDDAQRSRRPIWISVLAGSDNNSDYAYLGTIWEDAEKLTYAHGVKSRIARDAPSAVAAEWFAKALNYPDALARSAEVWHEGRCGRCGRRLTVPASIASGIGPECARIGGAS